MLRPLDNYYFEHDAEISSCLQFLREYILRLDENITEALKYGMPFFCYKQKMCCYLWVHKKYKQPYIGIVEGKWMTNPHLIQENRARMKILLIDQNKDLPMDIITAVLEEMLALYRQDK